MFRVLKREPQNDDIHLIEAACLSDDDKEIGFATGSLCLEVDTGFWFAYDEVGEEWSQITGGDAE